MGLPQASLSRQRPGPKRDSNGATPVKVAVQFGSLGRQNRGFLCDKRNRTVGARACLSEATAACRWGRGTMGQHLLFPET